MGMSIFGGASWRNVAAFGEIFTGVAALLALPISIIFGVPQGQVV